MLYQLQTVFDGLTGFVEFDHQGLRSNISVDVMDLKSFGFVKAGVWQSDSKPRLNMSASDQIPISSDSESGPISNKTFRVIIAIVSMSQIHFNNPFNVAFLFLEERAICDVQARV